MLQRLFKVDLFNHGPISWLLESKVCIHTPSPGTPATATAPAAPSARESAATAR